jgi:hypothetical protein
MWADHLRRRRKADHALWAVLMLQAWLDYQRAYPHSASERDA